MTPAAREEARSYLLKQACSIGQWIKNFNPTAINNHAQGDNQSFELTQYESNEKAQPHVPILISDETAQLFKTQKSQLSATKDAGFTSNPWNQTSRNGLISKTKLLPSMKTLNNGASLRQTLQSPRQ
jgi:hypothetical protein